MIDEHPLVLLLAEDGIHLPDGPGAVKRVPCWFSDHDGHDSMEVDTIAGAFECAVCRAEGNAWTYLVRCREQGDDNARAALGGLGANAAFIDAVARRHEEMVERRQLARLGRPRHVRGFREPDHIVSEHVYLDAGGDHVCTVARYKRNKRLPVRGGSLPERICYVPASDGGWWLCDPDHRGLPDEDAWPDKLPLYGLGALAKATQAVPAMVVDHEHHADAINACRKLPALCPFNGPGSHPDRTDWSPLAGRNVFIVASAHRRSRRLARRLAAELSPLCHGIKIALPPGETRYGPADAAADDPKQPWRSMRGWLDPLMQSAEPMPSPDLKRIEAVLHTRIEAYSTPAKRVSIASLLREGWVHEGQLITDRKHQAKGDLAARERAAALGWRFLRGRLVMALRCDPLHELVKGGPYPNLEIDAAVSRMPGAKRYRSRSGTVSRLPFAGTLYGCVELPFGSARRLKLFHVSEEELRE